MPQGLVLDPALLILFINDLFNFCTMSCVSVTAYADDTNFLVNCPVGQVEYYFTIVMDRVN